jgi:hypothetical protein
MMLMITHPQVVLRSWMRRSYTSSSPCASMVCSGTDLPLPYHVNYEDKNTSEQILFHEPLADFSNLCITASSELRKLVIFNVTLDDITQIQMCLQQWTWETPTRQWRMVTECTNTSHWKCHNRCCGMSTFEKLVRYPKDNGTTPSSGH